LFKSNKYATCSGNKGQLGVGEVIAHLKTPRLVDSFPNGDDYPPPEKREDDFVHDVACGDGFTVALVTDGETASDPSLSRHARQTLHESNTDTMASTMPLGE
jgi:alpha-tubulin suppressor-like RCC1 family protein